MKNKLLILLVLICIGFSGMFLKELMARNAEQNKFEALQNQVEQIKSDDFVETSDEMLAQYAPLYEQNADMIGWLKIENTNVNYPVMQTKDDEEFYLRRNFEKEYSIFGTPFLSANSDVDQENSQVIIYGHNINSGNMFADLLQYKNEKFFQENPIVSFDTLNEERKYEVFATFPIDVAKDNGHFQFYNYTEFNSQNTFDTFISEISKLSLHKIENPPEFQDDILTMITCDKNNSTIRFVVMAKLIDEK